jgi:hypothetical protein
MNRLIVSIAAVSLSVACVHERVGTQTSSIGNVDGDGAVLHPPGASNGAPQVVPNSGNQVVFNRGNWVVSHRGNPARHLEFGINRFASHHRYGI